MAKMCIEESHEQVESTVQSKRELRKVRCCADIDARSSGSRVKIGLPEKSFIWPFRDNRLDHTRCWIPGVHWPYAYVAGKTSGAPFCCHKEDAGLVSVNILYHDDKFWNCVAAKHARLLEEELFVIMPHVVLKPAFMNGGSPTKHSINVQTMLLLRFPRRIMEGSA